MCPKCGGVLCWTDWQGKPGNRVTARCEYHLRERQIDYTKAECDFECIAERQSDMEIIFEYYPPYLEQIDLPFSKL